MTFLRKLNWLARRRRKEEELEAELRFHLDEEAEERRAQGLSYEQARRAARRDLGNPEAVRENTRDAWGWIGAERLWQDVRFGARMLRKNPGFTITAVATLAIGIGANATVFTIANAVLFKGFPLVAHNDRIVYITSGAGCCVSWPDFQDWRAQAKSFEGMALVHGVQRTLVDGSGYPEVLEATEVTSNTFPLTGRGPILGRDFAPADEAYGASPVVMLSYRLWNARYARDPHVIGHVVRLNKAVATVIGVMPEGFTFPQKADLWVPLVATPKVQMRGNRETWFVFGRLAAGATIESARSEMEMIGRRLGDAYPVTNRGRSLVPHVLNFRDFFIGPNSTLIYEAMFGAVGFVLLIACANLANLLLERSLGRAREFSVRIAMGAGRWRLTRQLLIESLMLSGMGGVAGWCLAEWGVRLYALSSDGAGLSDAILGSWFDGVLDYSMDGRVLGYSIAITVLTGLLFGLAPALRLSKFNIGAALKDGGRGATIGTGARSLTSLIVVVEMALAIVLLAGAGVTIRSFLNLSRVETGVRAEGVFTTRFSLPQDRYPDDRSRTLFYEHLVPRLKAIPGVQSAALENALPGDRPGKVPFELAGAVGDERNRPTVAAVTVGPEYFQTLGARVLAGRDFTDADVAQGVPVALVNQRFADRAWPGEPAVGRHLRLFDTKAGVDRVVAGVVSNIRQNSAAEGEMNDLVYLPWRQSIPPSMWIAVRSNLMMENVGTALRRELRTLDPTLPLGNPSALTARLGSGYAFRGSVAVLLAIFAGIALLLAATGLYGVVANSVSRRTQEIGIRVAIGASASDIRRLVMAQGLAPFGAGLALGLAAAFALTPVLKSVLARVSPADPLAFAGATGALLLAAVAGCLIPARRALRVDPAIALRHD